MIIKGLEANINGIDVKTQFPDSSIIIVKSAFALDVIHIIECMLTYDFVSVYDLSDKQAYNIEYKKITDTAKLFLKDTDLYVRNSSVIATDKNPLIHTIRYLKKGIYRSTYTSDDKKTPKIVNDFTVYSDIFDYKTWCRIIETVNNLIGEEFVVALPNKLKFNITNTGAWSEDATKLAYMLIAESYVLQGTCKDRVFLLPNIVDVMTKEQALKLFDVLKGIQGDVLIISDLNFTFNELVGHNDIKLISI